ncbi:Serine--glyoxylate aminotransferase [Ancistrocladus abbreviatus]
MGTYWPYTPSIHLLYGLRAALDLIFEEGLDNVIARHGRLAKATRPAVETWGLKNCAQKEEWFSDAVMAVVVPPYIDSSQIVKRAWQRYNLSLGLGLNKVAVFWIGHLGNLNELQLLGCLAGVEMVLKDVGYPVKLETSKTISYLKLEFVNIQWNLNANLSFRFQFEIFLHLDGKRDFRRGLLRFRFILELINGGKKRRGNGSRDVDAPFYDVGDDH